MPRQRKQTEIEKQMFEASLDQLRDEFRSDLQLFAHSSVEQSQLAILCAPLDYKAEAVRVQYWSFGYGLFVRLREGFLTRARTASSSGFWDFFDPSDLSLFDWVDQTLGTDLAWVLVPGSVQFRFKSPHPRDGELVTGSQINALERHDWYHLEEIRYPLLKQDAEFYSKILNAWFPEDYKSAVLERASWVTDTRIQPGDLAVGLKDFVHLAATEARDRLTWESLPEDVSELEESGKEGNLRRQKTVDLSRYLDGSRATEKQKEAYSLHKEYGYTKAEVARRLGIHRKTTSERIWRAEENIKLAWSKERMLKQSAKKPSF